MVFFLLASPLISEFCWVFFKFARKMWKCFRFTGENTENDCQEATRGINMPTYIAYITEIY